MTFLIEKMKLVSFSLFLDAFPPRPKMPFDMPLYTYTTYVNGVLGLGGGGGGGGEGLYKQKKTSNI